MRGCTLLIHINEWVRVIMPKRQLSKRFKLLESSFVKGYLLLALLGIGSPTFGQFGNEWINYNQSYYRIPVIKNGIHRLTYEDLSSAGVPVNSIDPRRVQVFRRGTEQAINFHYLEAPADNQFEAGEYLEFYGEKNDGATDVDLYKNPAHHPHPYYNLYSDTATYFLTWNLLPVQGKRMQQLSQEFNVNNLPVETGFTNTILQVLSNQYSAGLTFTALIQNSFFDEGEGWTGTLICTQGSGCTGQQDFLLNVPRGVTSLDPPMLDAMLVGRGAVGHTAEIYAGPNAASLRLVITSSFQNFQSVNVMAPLQWTDVNADGTITIRVKGLGVAGGQERISVSYLKLDYQRDFNLAGVNAQLLQTLPNAGGKSYIEIQNPSSGLRLFDITDLTASSIIGTYPAGSNLAAVISNTNSVRRLFATAEFFTPTVKKVSFRSITPSSHNYIIISNSVLRKPALGYADPVKAYAAYRASVAGGSHDTLVVNMDQLYSQFNYGETSSRAIYQFMKFMTGSGDPKYLFLIGKGLDINFAYDRKRVFLPTDLKDLVPSAGLPGSDLIFTAGLSGTTFEPAVPTGRLTATNATDVASYLNKIKETELLPFDNLWRKDILHLSGGINPGEPQLFKYYVDGFKSIAEDVYLGARVDTKSKRTFDLETIPISDQVNSGLALITFFGHSSSSTLDFDIGFVTNPVLNYNNPGKYPVFIINGCNVGRIYSNGKNFGEDWMLAQNKGAKAFIAHSSFGGESALRQYSDLFYRIGFGDSIFMTKGIGDVQKAVTAELLAFGGPTISTLSIMHQMVLMGDPAVKLFGAPKPDYAIKDEFLSKVSFDGTPITAATKSFGIQYKIQNYGQARNDSLKIILTRTFPDNSIVTYDTIIPPVFYESVFVFVVPNPDNQGGQNTFTIEIDQDNELSELNETNNVADFILFIPGSSTFNLVPYHYSIVNSTSVELIFQNTNQIPAFRDYQLELDTLPTFNSPFLVKRKIGANVLVRHVVTIPSKDSTVYYWRTKLDQPSENESPDWFTTSFSYIIGGVPGWTQLKYPQFSENKFSTLQQDAWGKLSFPEFVSTVFVQNFGSANPAPYTSTSFKVNNEELNLGTQGQPCRNNTINLVTFDKSTGNTYPAIPFNFQDPRTCGREPQVINSFTLTEAEAASNGLAQAITNIAVNDSVVFFTIGNGGVGSWSAALISKLGEVGLSSSQISGFQAGEPMIFFGKKGVGPGAAQVFRPSVTPLNQQELVVNKTITARSKSGTMSSPWIGPAKGYSYVIRKVNNAQPSDNFSVKVIGLASGNQEVVLYNGNNSYVNLAFIDPEIYPLIKLQLTTTDETNLTPVDLKNWMVRYSPVPEGILLFRGSSAPVSLQEGEMWSGKFSFINLTGYVFEHNDVGVGTLDVGLKIFNQDNSITETQSIQIATPFPKDSTIFNWETGTIGWAGINNLTPTVNTQFNPDQYNFNNQLPLESYLAVTPDEQPPVLDVTVDGRYLANGDVVSHTPVVKITIMDENIFRYKTDTAGIQIFIKDLNTEVSKRINFTHPALDWSPASPETDFQISFQTELNAGEYELSVQGADASGNPSGETPYTVSFLVTDELSVQFGEPFPNPSSNSFSFPIRLSGNELPESMSLKILSPDGRLMHHFGLSDVSGFYVGSNYLKWNAQDADGADIPNGLYYFKLELSVSGKDYSKVGRLVLIR